MNNIYSYSKRNSNINQYRFEFKNELYRQQLQSKSPHPSKNTPKKNENYDDYDYHTEDN